MTFWGFGLWFIGVYSFVGVFFGFGFGLVPSCLSGVKNARDKRVFVFSDSLALIN